MSKMIGLRDYRQEDADRLVELANNQKVSRYLIYTFPYPYLKKDAEWWIEVGSRENSAVTKAIELDGVFVGSVGITPQAGWKKHMAEIGYWIGEDYWGQGIATEALRQMTDLALSELGFTKLFAPVLQPNSASIKVLEKNHYQLEGELKKEVEKNGKYFDIYHYAKYRA